MPYLIESNHSYIKINEKAQINSGLFHIKGAIKRLINKIVIKYPKKAFC